MENINIDDYKDYENISIAQYTVACNNAKRILQEASKRKDFQSTRHYAKIYFELNRLLGMKVRRGSGLGYKPKGHSK